MSVPSGLAAAARSAAILALGGIAAVLRRLDRAPRSRAARQGDPPPSGPAASFSLPAGARHADACFARRAPVFGAGGFAAAPGRGARPTSRPCPPGGSGRAPRRTARAAIDRLADLVEALGRRRTCPFAATSSVDRGRLETVPLGAESWVHAALVPDGRRCWVMGHDGKFRPEPPAPPFPKGEGA